MPEIKHNFTGGKMNKDVDQRLVPKGEYRDAMNIQVSTSEGSDVGTVQNILGNSLISELSYLSSNSTCVGAVADEKNDALYWLVTDVPSDYYVTPGTGTNIDTTAFTSSSTPGPISSYKDMILQLKGGIIKPVFVAKRADAAYTIYHGLTWDSTAGTITFPSSLSVADLQVGMTLQGESTTLQMSFTGMIVSDVDVSTNTVTIDGDITWIDLSVSTGQGPQGLHGTKLFFLSLSGGEQATILGFRTGSLITGINIIDDMLFWTDGVSEPKKINIPRSIQGTSANGNSHTRLINPDQGIVYNSGILIQEEHITVIRKAPKTVLTIQTETDPNFAFGTTLDINFLIDPSNPALGNVTAGMGASFSIILLKDATSTVGLNTNDVILFNPALTGSGTTGSPPNDTHEVSGILTNQVNWGSADYVDGSGNVLASAGTYVIWEVAVQQISFLTTTNDLEYNWAVKIPEIEKFKNKFTRFSYRYKYLDGEYSSYAPFTPVVFKPKNFKYNVKEAYNIGMENNISKIVLSGYNSNLPLDVSGIELLYKESHSPVVYSIDTIRKYNNLTSTTSSYEVRSNQIKAALPENQLLRPWDNVPRTSLAQEVTGSRIVYGNYLQNYNIKDNPILNAELVSREDCDVNSGYKSLKSMRNYTLGVSYLDEYGRQSPVFTNKSAVVQIPINKSSEKNQVSTTLVGDAPDWAKHYKVFIKQTADEYYNMAMDRIYDAKDGNIWLSFPSSDRNKIDDETFLILKKGVDDQVVSELNRYKVLAIENEAPTFIKTKNSFVASAQEDGTGAFLYFTNPSSYPIEGSASISIDKTPWDTVNIPLSDIPLMTVQFTTQNSGGATQYTRVYDVTSFAEDTSAGTYDLSLDKGITEDWVSDAANVSLPDSTIGIRVSKKTVENRPEFDGRFFVKVTRDIILDENVISQGTANQVEQVAAQLPFYYLADGDNPYNGYNTTSPNNTSNTETEWDDLLDPTGNGIDSMWFIDSAFYSGYYDDPSILQNCGVIGCGEFGMTYDNRTNPPTKNETGYKKGIYTEGGQAYIDLSFGYIKAADGAGANSPHGYAMHTDDSDTVRVGHVFGSLLGADFVQHDGTDAFFQEIGDHPGNGHDNWESNDDLIKHWKVGSSLNTWHNSSENVEIVTKLVQNSRFRFTNDPNGTVYTISGTPEVTYNFNYKNLGSYYDSLHDLLDEAFYPGAYDQYTGIAGYSGGSTLPGIQTNLIALTGVSHYIKGVFNALNQATKATNKRVTWKIPITCEDGPDDPTDAASSYNPLALITATTPGTIQFVEKVWESVDGQVVSDNPAIWETEPKLDVDLDIYYEVDGTFPLEVNTKTNYTFAPVGSSVSIQQPANQIPVIQPNTTVVSWRGDVVELSIEANDVDMAQNMQVVFSRSDGSCVTAKLKGLAEPITPGPGNTSFFLQIEPNVSNEPVKLSWFNCYSFGNGVESNRIRDDYNQVKIDKGVKASSTLDEPYQEEHRKHGLIYSGLYNSTSGVNNLNQFIAAEKITKDINPIYGSIQKLKAGWGQGGDLIALCEDRVLKILANKDALFNADGNSNVTSTNNVLGQAIPYSGEYGISKNPESFASEAYRIYFTDKVRGTVMRLSMDGLTPISNHGMKDWFRDNLKLGGKLIGSYDDKKDEYNITIKGGTIAKTVTFREDVKGWVSFKSFIPENAISCANEYYTFKDGNIWRHHDELVDRNTFYNTSLLFPENFFEPSTLEVIFNEVPGSVKSFKTVNYEGSQAKVTLETNDNEYFNLEDVPGWHVIAKDGVQGGVVTNLERGGITEFIKKEGKWFGYVVGDDVNVSDLGNISSTSNYDTEDFSIQGVGSTTSVVSSIIFGCMDDGGSTNLDVFGDGSNVVGVFASPSVPGTAAFNYISAATNDDGSCIDMVMGCIDPIASNTDGNANTDDGSCIYPGCTIPLATLANEMSGGGSLNFDPNANFDDGSCIMATYGCTLVGFANTNIFADFGSSILETAGTFCGSENCMCIPVIYGCTDPNASNPPQFVYELTDINTDDGSCEYLGCTDPLAENYDLMFVGSTVDGPNGNLTFLNGTAVDDLSCTYIGGCTDDTACNYDADATQDDGSCYFCGDDAATNYDAVYPFTDYTCAGTCTFCEDVASVTIDSQTTATSGMSDGTITIEWPESTSATFYEVYGAGITTATITPSGNATETHTITGLGTGTYTIYVSTFCTASAGNILLAGAQLPGGNMGTGPNFGTPVSTTITATPQLGCTDNTGTNTTFGAAGMTPINGQTWGACNYDPIATQDDGSCDYTSCAGCTDPLYVEYDAVFTQPSPNAAIAAGYCTTLIVSGCTDATAFNYDPINPPNADCAGVVGGTDTSCCQPVVNGCMDDTLNNDGTTYAASNYSGPPVGSANTDDGSCNDYNCPYGLNSSISSGGASFVFKVLNFTTPYAFSDITRTATIGGTVVASFASSNNVYQGTDNIGKRFSEPTAGYFTAGVDTSITVDFNVTTTDGNCDVNATTKTFTIGCMDPNADVSGGFDIADNTQCDYTGCMISNACNYETYYNIQDNGTCVYCGDPAAYNYDGAVGSCTSLCFYTGCMDDTLQADGSGYAASNYITTNPADTLPCNTTGVTGDAGYDSAFDNDCCTYNTTPGVEFSILFGEIPQVFYDTTDTGYTEGSMSTITIGSGGTTLTHAGNSQASMNATTNSRLAFAWVNGSLPITSGSFGWHPYVNNGQLDISVTNAVFNGNCDNPSINDQLPTGYASDSVSWSVGCKTDSTAFNYDPNVDLHLPSSCVAVNSGCMDDNAWATIPSNNTATAAGLSGYDAAYNTACGTSGSTTDTSCCCFDTACDVFAALGTTSYNLGNQELTIPITLVPCARKYQYATRHYDGSWNSWSTATDVPASQTTLGNIVEGVSVLWPTMYGNNSVNKQIRVRAVCTDATPTTYSPWQQATVTYTY